jgi:hypothetical protein
MAKRATVSTSALLLLLAIAPPSHAQTASVPVQLAGTWVYDGTREAEMHIVDRAFASTVATLPELLQGFARDRVRTEMEPPYRVIVSLEGGRIHVTLERERRTTIEGALGAPATATGVADGTRVSSRLQGGWLEIAYEGEGSVLRQLYSTEPDGARMHLDFDVTGGRLPRPVRYRLDFVHPRS